MDTEAMQRLLELTCIESNSTKQNPRDVFVSASLITRISNTVIGKIATSASLIYITPMLPT
jgi:hypothetical protein